MCLFFPHRQQRHKSLTLRPFAFDRSPPRSLQTKVDRESHRRVVIQGLRIELGVDVYVLSPIQLQHPTILRKDEVINRREQTLENRAKVEVGMKKTKSLI